jgi:hypothetical protein
MTFLECVGFATIAGLLFGFIGATCIYAMDAFYGDPPSKKDRLNAR